jgi:hypothetical protein
MDPLSITTACLGATGTIAKLATQISVFIGTFRDVANDMRAVSQELTSLTTYLSKLFDDSRKVNFPDILLHEVVSCDSVAEQMRTLLLK